MISITSLVTLQNAASLAGAKCAIQKLCLAVLRNKPSVLQTLPVQEAYNVPRVSARNVVSVTAIPLNRRVRSPTELPCESLRVVCLSDASARIASSGML